jgi:hypothetical protein
MWVLKTHGETFYVKHVDCKLPWSTKETPDNASTKGSIKLKQCLLTINDNNEAEISPLTLFDKIRLRNQKLGITRIIWTKTEFDNILKNDNIKHSPFRRIQAPCSTGYTVCDILEPEMVTILGLKYTGMFRVLKPNEPEYKAYDDSALWRKLQAEYAGDGEEDESEDE